MNPVALNLSRLDHLNRETRTIRIAAIRTVSFARQIELDWDELARIAVEGIHQRANVRREFRGV